MDPYGYAWTRPTEELPFPERDREIFSCDICNNYFSNRRDMVKRHKNLRHQRRKRSADGAAPISKVWRPWEDVPNSGKDGGERDRQVGIGGENDFSEDNRLAQLISANWARIRTYKTTAARRQDRYNFQMNNGSTHELMSYVIQIFTEQSSPFKMNISFGFVLQHIQTKELIYYYASNNNRLLPSPILVRKRQDLDEIASRFDQEDLLEYCRMQRPNTQYVVRKITNVLFYINKIVNYSIGVMEAPELPAYIRNKRSLVTFARNRRGEPYRDQLCFFRCLAYHQDPTSQNVSRIATRLMHRFCQDKGINSDDFQGVSLDDLSILEDLFSINIEVYNLTETEVRDDNDELVTTTRAEKVRSSRVNPEREVLYLNLYDRHFSLIIDIGAYSSCWACSKCGKLFNRRFNATTHERNCSAKTTLVFPGGGYGPPKSIFDLLVEEGIEVPDDLQYYPYRLTFDLECYFEQYQTAEAGEARKEVILNELIPASVSVCSNVPEFTEPKCFISDGDPSMLMHLMYTYMLEISEASYRLMLERFQPLMRELNARMEDLEGDAGVGGLEHYEGDNVPGEVKNTIFRINTHEKLLKQLNSWLRKIVALGFNSSRFDFNLMRKYLFPYFISSNVQLEGIIKKNSDYLSVTTPHIIFLDVKNYLAAGISYEKWLQCYHIPEGKQRWPYEWFTSLDKLQDTQLPERQQFWSSLKQQGISEEEYEHLKQVWKREGFRNMKDMLCWYNNADVTPFLIAAQELFNYWKGLGIDPFKGGAISLPGLAMSYLIKRMQPHTILPLFSEQTQDLYHLMRANIVGGLSIVNHRYHEAGVTKLPNGAPVEWIYSFDCNALYLSSLGKKMGTGIFARWLSEQDGMETPPWKIATDEEENAENRSRWHEVLNRNMEQSFRRSYSSPYCRKEVEWLEWTAKVDGKLIEHRFNGQQKVVRVNSKVKYPVDGFVPKENCIYQFHGCFWHGHGCHLDGNNSQERQRRYQDTAAVTHHLRELGYTVIEKWECGWDAEKRGNPAIQMFLDENLNLTMKRNKLSAGEIVRAVLDNEFFGMILCDVEVPPWNTELVSFFEEFPPICKNTEISRDDIGDHMRQFAESRGYMKKPRRNLINSYWARKILVITPLLLWFLEHGLRITRIYEAIEMKAKACFGCLPEEIADHRRRADEDPAYKPIGESYKTQGNSMYGRLMNRKELHKDNLVVPDQNVDRYINDKRFHKMEEVGDIAYEVSMDKKRIKLDLPLYIAVFVYNYAKLRMNEYVWDFMNKYLRPGSYQIVCSDTDSIIAAYESKDVDKLVKPELQQEYQEVGKPSFLSTDPYSMRTPGLFKVETSATGIVALCSKTYFTWNDVDGSNKLSSKGLSKRTNKLGKNDFIKVLESKEKGKGTNYGFKVKGDRLVSYKQEREGLAYLYVKRRVLDDGISTKALHL